MRAALAALIGVVVLVVGFLVRPVTPTLDDDATGDGDLITTVREAGYPGHRLTVVVLEGDTERVARFDGATGSTRYEVGSITKAITGLLLADAVDRGELTLEDRLETHLDVGTGEVSRLTLGEIATHSSGLPRLSTGLADLPGELWAQLSATNPYHETRDQVIAETAGIRPGEKTFRYSNLGAALAGHAVAAAAHTRYPDLVQERILDPLQLTGTAVQTGPPLVEPGLDQAGRSQEPWSMDGMAPAGAIVSTSDDLALLARAVLAGQAPGMAALDPVTTIEGDEQIGMFWFTENAPEGSYAWHDGATGGYSGFIAVDRQRGRAVIVLNASNEGAPQLGRELMTDPRTWR